MNNLAFRCSCLFVLRSTRLCDFVGSFVSCQLATSYFLRCTYFYHPFTVLYCLHFTLQSHTHEQMDDLVVNSAKVFLIQCKGLAKKLNKGLEQVCLFVSSTGCVCVFLRVMEMFDKVIFLFLFQAKKLRYFNHDSGKGTGGKGTNEHLIFLIDTLFVNSTFQL